MRAIAGLSGRTRRSLAICYGFACFLVWIGLIQQCGSAVLGFEIGSFLLHCLAFMYTTATISAGWMTRRMLCLSGLVVAVVIVVVQLAATSELQAALCCAITQTYSMMMMTMMLSMLPSPNKHVYASESSCFLYCAVPSSFASPPSAGSKIYLK
jgi:K+ transporter